jgi:ring-1,2-phenylacetyl-CoA epoxidase subunit PaaD
VVIRPAPSTEAIGDVLATIPDPEMPISIVDLGLIESVAIDAADDGAHVTIVVLPTFVGCPALDLIRSDIESRVGAIDGVAAVEVRFVHDPPWSVDRITDVGRAALREHGVTVPTPRTDGKSTPVALRTSAVACPFCGSRSTTLESAFGPTRCRMIMYCEGCRNSFEHMKALDGDDAGVDEL